MTLQGVKQRFGIIGTSPELDRAIDTAMRVAATDLTVLVQGQSGVGKESFSQIIHQLSARKHNAFIAVNCGAIPSGTINSELFGHEKGAFTGATADRKGYFETVDTGTIFLDEVGEMPLDTQAYLLRILESGEYFRVGSSQTRKTDVRIVAATNVDLMDRVKQNRFREDLFYRLNTVPIRIPSLSERRQDIFLLFRKFALDFSERYRTEPVRLEDSARLVIENYAWPGNVRELRNVAEQLSVMSTESRVEAEQLYAIVPKLKERNLPARRFDGAGETGAGANVGAGLGERDILYRLLFDMKGDLNELKGVLAELISNNNLRVSRAQLEQLEDADVPRLRALGAREQRYNGNGSSNGVSNGHKGEVTEASFGVSRRFGSGYGSDGKPDAAQGYNGGPIIIDAPHDFPYDSTAEVVEENLSLEEMEKVMIKKALERNKSRRREAAEELGISERTLYRKIKQYDI